MISVQLVGGRELLAKLNALGANGTREAMGRAVAETTIALHRRVVRDLSQPGTGRLYRRRGVMHRASSPGRPPAVDLGTYRQSVQPDLTGVASRGEGTVGPRGAGMIRRGRWLEYGTRRMAARPHLGPAAVAETPLFKRRAEAAISAALRSKTGRGR